MTAPVLKIFIRFFLHRIFRAYLNGVSQNVQSAASLGGP